MKKSFRIDIYRSIRQSLSRFIAILAIVALGAGFFAGLRACAPYMRKTVDTYYKNTDMMDIHILSTLGFSQENVDAVKRSIYVDKVQATYSLDAVASLHDNTYNARLHGLPSDSSDYVSQLTLKEGRLPQKNGECVAVQSSDSFYKYEIGDQVSLSVPEEDINDYLKSDKMTIVGIVISPYYISHSLGTTQIGNGNLEAVLYTLNSSFSYDAYTELFITASDSKSYLSFDDDYDEYIDSVQASIESLGIEQAEIRRTQIITEARERLADAQQRLDAERAKAMSELGKAKTELDSAELEIEAAKKKLDDGSEQYNRAFAGFEANKQRVEAEMQKAQQQIDAMPAPMPDMQAQLDRKRLLAEQQLNSARAQLSSLKSELDSGYSELKKGQSELDKGKTEYESKRAKVMNELASAQAEIDKSKKEIDNIGQAKWYVLDRNTNSSFVEFASDASRINSISTTFPLIFFMVAALVALTTMTRMVDDERILIGTYKALGYGKLTIMLKYLIYAGLATIAGSVIGTLICSQVLPRIVWGAYSMLYNAPTLSPGLHLQSAVTATLLSIICTFSATIFACGATLHEVPANLMHKRAPKAGRRILLERITPIWKRMSFLKKVTARNLFRYKKRLLMTVIGIAGCTALLVTGFGIKDSVADVVSNQYGDICKYDAILGIGDEPLSDDSYNILDDKSFFSDYLLTLNKSIEISANNKKINGSIFVPNMPQQLDTFVNLRTRRGQKKVHFTDESVVISEKMTKTLGINIGDEITLKDIDNNETKLKITDVTENYIGQLVYISPNTYQKVFGKSPEYNQAVAILQPGITSQQKEVLSNTIDGNSEITTLKFLNDITTGFEDMISTLNTVIVVLIISAGLLAFIVLYNLTNINVTERERELATIKVLGFYDREVSSYIYRETAILTIIGCIAGLIAGVFLHNYVIQTVEVDMVMFSRQIHVMSFVWSALLTCIFALFVNFVMYYKLKKIDMVDSLKSVD